jgi:hypothetical protein
MRATIDGPSPTEDDGLTVWVGGLLRRRATTSTTAAAASTPSATMIVAGGSSDVAAAGLVTAVTADETGAGADVAGVATAEGLRVGSGLAVIEDCPAEGDGDGEALVVGLMLLESVAVGVGPLSVVVGSAGDGDGARWVMPQRPGPTLTRYAGRHARRLLRDLTTVCG